LWVRIIFHVMTAGDRALLDAFATRVRRVVASVAIRAFGSRFANVESSLDS
jgi:hypothetical protein